MTALFWLLDIRNVRLLDGPEALLKQAEREAAKRSSFTAFETIAETDKPPLWIRYGNSYPPRFRFSIMPAFFIAFLLASLLATGYGAWQAVAAPTPEAASSNGGDGSTPPQPNQ